MPKQKHNKNNKGNATIETALILPILLLFLAVLLTIVSLGVTQLKILAGSYSIARSLARGENETTTLANIKNTIGTDTQIQITQEPPLIKVTLSTKTKNKLSNWLGVEEIFATSYVLVEKYD